MINNKKLNPIVTELLLKAENLIVQFFLLHSHIFKIPKEVKINCAHFLIMKIPNKGELGQTAKNHLTNIYFKNFMNIYKKCTGKPYSFLVNDTTLPSDNPLQFRKNVLKQTFRINI